MSIFKLGSVVLAALIIYGLCGCSTDGDGPLRLPIDFIEMELISAGTFKMGSPGTEPWTTLIQPQTQRDVTLTQSFYVGRYVVTQNQYRTVMGKNPSFFNNTGAKTDTSVSPPLEYDTTPAPGENQGNRPVEWVSWYDALIFCNRLSIATGLEPAYRISGSTNPADWGAAPTGGLYDSTATAWNAVEIVNGSKGFRLPTEAQWEYTCRAGTTSSYNNGEDAEPIWELYSSAPGNIMSIEEALEIYPDLFDVIPGWHRYNSDDRTHEVSAGEWGPNDWGLYNMHGNVWEWCWDKHTRGNDYDPADTTDPMGPASGDDRIERNGGFRSRPDAFMRSGARNSVSPSTRSNDLGFRVVRPE